MEYIPNIPIMFSTRYIECNYCFSWKYLLICKRANVLFTLFVFACIKCFCFAFIRLLVGFLGLFIYDCHFRYSLTFIYYIFFNCLNLIQNQVPFVSKQQKYNTSVT